ncbi:MAG: universal stress protein [Mycobacterium sp.]|nr:universal stress protein [Mycobacterium sp.]
MNQSAIVVGVDGSKAATRAALWALDEAVCRDVPLRLLCAVEQGDSPATADLAIGRAITAVKAAATTTAKTTAKATAKAARMDIEVTVGPAASSLIRASASAAMVCVGAVGLRHFRPGRVRSTATALALSARCPVAIVRGRDGDADFRHAQDAIVVGLDGAPDNGVLLGAAIEESSLRDAGIRAVICRRTVPGEAAEGDGDRRALADLDRRLSCWKRRYPDLRVESVVVRGSVLQYLAGHHRSARLLIAGAHNRQQLGELVGPVGAATLQDAACSLLIVNRQHL